MPVTRRQSGKLPPSRFLPESQKDKDSEDEDSSESDSEQDDPDSDVDDSHKIRGLAKKRAKTQSGSKGGRKKAPAKLRLLPSMPLDILFEIFGHLSPKELLHLARTTKSFRATLLSRNATSIWKAARSNSNLPECPADMSEPSWANLFFGTTCSSCGAKNISKPECALRRRVCVACKKANYVHQSQFAKKFPDFAPVIMDLILYTDKGGWSHGHRSYSKFFWQDDIYSMSKQLGGYQKDLYMNKRGANQALDDFKKTRMTYVQKARELAETCQDWVDDAEAKQHQNLRDKEAKRCQDITDRLIALGWEKCDVSHWEIQRLPQFYKPTELTERSWKNLRPGLESKLEDIKQSRLARERDARISARKLIAKDVYIAYQRTLLPSQWRYLPDIMEVVQFERFASVINAADDVVVQASHFDDAVAELPGRLSTWIFEQQRHLLTLLSSDASGMEVEEGGLTGGACTSHPRLELVTSAFKCFNSGCPRIFFGWEEAIIHECYQRLVNVYESPYRRKPVLALSRRGTAIAKSILEASGLDSATARPSDLDRLDLRYICNHCPCILQRRIRGKAALSWRDCVTHVMAVGFEGVHSSPSWSVLPPAEMAEIKLREIISYPDWKNVWSCSHCSLYNSDWQIRQVVLEHIKMKHNIPNPVNTVDFFHDPSRPRQERAGLMFAIGPQIESGSGPSTEKEVPQYLCMHCQGSTRLFILQGIKSHLQAKHKINDLKLNVDFRR